MANWTIATLNTSIVTTLATITGIKTAWDLSDLLENIPNADLPLLMVYPDTINSATDSATNTNTFGSANTVVQRHDPVYNADFFFYPVGNSRINEVLPNMIGFWQLIVDKMDAQRGSSFFGNSAIKNVIWSSERTVIQYSQFEYHVIKLKITLGVY